MKNLIKLVLALVLLISVTSAVYYPYKSTFPLSADISMNNHKLTGLAAPTASNDAATKAYVDGTGGSGGSVGDPFVTVGPYAWCDFVTDGTADQIEINAALSNYKMAYLVNDGYFAISGNIIIPSGGKYYLIGLPYNGIKPELRFFSAHGITESDSLQKSFEISNIHINMNSQSGSAIQFNHGVINTEIFNCRIANITQADVNVRDGIGIEGTGTLGVTNLEIYSNVVEDVIGRPIYVAGVFDEDNMVVAGSINIHDNTVLHGRPYSIEAFAAIEANHAIIQGNFVLGYGAKGNTYVDCRGDGLSSVRGTTFANNRIFGTGKNGIHPGEESVVIGNVIKYCGSNGIDFYYSNNSNIIGNIVMDNGQAGAVGSMDMSGIDVADHTTDCLITGNIVSNDYLDITDTLSTVGTYGNNYITVNNLHRWVNCEGLRIRVGADRYRINRVNIPEGRLYLNQTLSATYASGMEVVSLRSQYVGIQIGDNGQSLGSHIVTGNFVMNNLFRQVGSATGGPLLPRVFVGGDGNFRYEADPGFLPSSSPYASWFGTDKISNYVNGIGTKSVTVT